MSSSLSISWSPDTWPGPLPLGIIGVQEAGGGAAVDHGGQVPGARALPGADRHTLQKAQSKGNTSLAVE